jgi:hypothetical protein
VKIQLCPEDTLLEYAEQIMKTGGEQILLKHGPYLERFPHTLEFSEEFAERWQVLCKAAVKRFVADTFALRPFLFDVDGYTKRFTCADEQFWQTCEFVFSHRGAERFYELMMKDITRETPMYIVAKADDALLLSMSTRLFHNYSFPWLHRNRANWLTQALFVAWQQVSIDKIPWQFLLEQPKEVELPLRDYLIERCTDVISACNQHFRGLAEAAGHAGEVLQVSPYGRPSLRVTFYQRTAGELIAAVNRFIGVARAAMDFWAGEGVIAIDDERFIKGTIQQYGFAGEVAELEQLIKDYQENRSVEEDIYESIIQNQNSN